MPDSEPDPDSDALFRDFKEDRRPLYLARAVRALNDAINELPDTTDMKARSELEAAIHHLETIAECMADAPLPCATAEALDDDSWFHYDELRTQYSITGSMPALVEAFVLLVRSGVSPGGWILDPLADAFEKSLDDRDPELVATHLGLQNRGSGSTSPLKSYSSNIKRAHVYFDMRTLVEDFQLSRTKSAEAVIEKFNLDVTAKTLVNSYKPLADYPPAVRRFLDKHSDALEASVVWVTDESREAFLDTFPESAHKYFKKIRPAKT